MQYYSYLEPSIIGCLCSCVPAHIYPTAQSLIHNQIEINAVETVPNDTALLHKWPHFYSMLIFCEIEVKKK